MIKCFDKTVTITFLCYKFMLLGTVCISTYFRDACSSGFSAPMLLLGGHRTAETLKPNLRTDYVRT